MMEVVVTTVRRAKLQSNHHRPETNTKCFTDQMPFLSPNQQCQSTEGKIWCYLKRRILCSSSVPIFSMLYYLTAFNIFPLVLGQCWLGDMKDIRPVKTLCKLPPKVHIWKTYRSGMTFELLWRHHSISIPLLLVAVRC